MTSSTSLNRAANLQRFTKAIEDLLKEKKNHYGDVGGFFEANQVGDYTHAFGEVKLKLGEFQGNGIGHRSLRILIKAAAWIYLAYESEVNGGSR